jgi:hypothetical protein
MIIYNVTIKVNSDIEVDWVQWIKKEHAPELLATGLFTDYRLCRLLEQDESEGSTFIVQYSCNNVENYNTYISKYAQEMRDKGLKRFGDKFIAMRTVMETID